MALGNDKKSKQLLPGSCKQLVFRSSRHALLIIKKYLFDESSGHFQIGASEIKRETAVLDIPENPWKRGLLDFVSENAFVCSWE